MLKVLIQQILANKRCPYIAASRALENLCEVVKLLKSIGYEGKGDWNLKILASIEKGCVEWLTTSVAQGLPWYSGRYVRRYRSRFLVRLI